MQGPQRAAEADALYGAVNSVTLYSAQKQYNKSNRSHCSGANDINVRSPVQVISAVAGLIRGPTVGVLWACGIVVG